MGGKGGIGLYANAPTMPGNVHRTWIYFGSFLSMQNRVYIAKRQVSAANHAF